jgi:hypothetical protein
VRVGLFAPGRLARQVHHHVVARSDAAVLDRLVPRRPLPQLLQRFLHRLVAHLRGLPRQPKLVAIARVDGRHRLERRRELERLPLLDDDVADVGRVHRLDALLAQRVVDGPRNQLMGHVMQDLLPKPLADQPLGNFSGTEPGNARGLRVVARNPVDLGIHLVAGDLHVQVLARFVDVDELCLHEDAGFEER